MTAEDSIPSSSSTAPISSAYSATNDDNNANNSNNSAFKFWETHLNKARYVVAPMVDQSELPWRLLCRRHGAQLCYTPMFHAQNFVNDPIYRRDQFQTCAEDRPLIVQFCANDPEILVQACRLVENQCQAVDLNLGCPQSIAKRGRYGAFLQDDWPLISRLVSAVRQEVKIPICCKIRIFEDTEKTVQYAKMLEQSGCQLLVVHGRTREQKGLKTGIADWSKIKAVKNAVDIPVFANGNIQYFEDVHNCLRETGVDGVMTAEGNLHNPFIFERKRADNNNNAVPCWEPALEYLDIVDQYPCSMTFVRGHLFKLFHFSMLRYPDLRECLATSNTVEDCRKVARDLKSRCQEYHEKFLEKCKNSNTSDSDSIPVVDISSDMDYFWLCRPYVRPSGEECDKQKRNDDSSVVNDCGNVVDDDGLKSSRNQILAIKRKHQEEIERLSEQYGVSKNKAKKLMRCPKKNIPEVVPELKKPGFNKCSCGNPVSPKCSFKLCKLCCRAKNGTTDTTCDVHRSQRERWEEKRPKEEATNENLQTAEA